MFDISIDGTKDSIVELIKLNSLFNQLEGLKKCSVLVGIPEEESERKKGEMSNAALLYIHSHGSPKNNLPARPLLEPAITEPNNAQRITEDLKMVAQALLDGKPAQAERGMKVAGQDAVNMIKNWFDDPRNGWEPNKPGTIKRKISKLKGKKKKAALVAQATGEKVDTVLVDTAQMKNAITYVIKEI